MKVCAIVPTYDNPQTVGDVVARIASHDLPVVLVDDGSAEPGRTACARIADQSLATVVHLDRNLGKGAACKAGFAKAQELGFSHAFQIDADGQHDLDQIPTFVAAAQREPGALILGYPIYDQTAPLARKMARWLTDFWVAVEVGGRARICDAMIGFRVYPLEAIANLPDVGNGMEFDIEVAVQLVRSGCATRNLPIRVRYLDKVDGGVSHFRPLRDNLRFARLHSRLCTVACMQWTKRKLWPLTGQAEPRS